MTHLLKKYAATSAVAALSLALSPFALAPMALAQTSDTYSDETTTETDRQYAADPDSAMENEDVDSEMDSTTNGYEDSDTWPDQTYSDETYSDEIPSDDMWSPDGASDEDGLNAESPDEVKNESEDDPETITPDTDETEGDKTVSDGTVSDETPYDEAKYDKARLVPASATRSKTASPSRDNVFVHGTPIRTQSGQSLGIITGLAMGSESYVNARFVDDKVTRIPVITLKFEGDVLVTSVSDAHIANHAESDSHIVG